LLLQKLLALGTIEYHEKNIIICVHINEMLQTFLNSECTRLEYNKSFSGRQEYYKLLSVTVSFVNALRTDAL